MLASTTSNRRPNLTDLWVTYATGQQPSARMTIAAPLATIHVDATGATCPVVVAPLIWIEKKLLPSDGAAFDYAGEAVSVSSETAVVGAWASSDSGFESGAAYVFVRNGTTWREEQKLSASDGEAQDCFAVAVSVSDDVAVISRQRVRAARLRLPRPRSRRPSPGRCDPS